MSVPKSRKLDIHAEIAPLPGEDPAAIAARVESWREHFRSRNPAQAYLVTLCARATLHSDRSERLLHALLADQVRAAEEDFDRDQRRERARLRDLLWDDPAEAVRLLEHTADGCRYLIGCWETFLDLLRGPGRLSHDSFAEALRVLGEDPDRFDFDTFARTWRLRHAPSRASIDDLMPRLLDAGELSPARAEARALLILEGEALLARLRPREEHLRTRIERPSRAEAADRALIVREPAVARLVLRYQAESRGAFHRAYTALLKARAAGPDDEDDEEIEDKINTPPLSSASGPDHEAPSPIESGKPRAPHPPSTGSLMLSGPLPLVGEG